MKELDEGAPASVTGAGNVAASGAQGVKPVSTAVAAAKGRRRSSDDEDTVRAVREKRRGRSRVAGLKGCTKGV